MISKDKEHHWIHRVTRQIIRAVESPGTDYERLREPWEMPKIKATPAPAKPYNPLRHGLED